MSPLDIFLGFCFVGFSIILLLVSFLAYRRRPERRMLFVLLAFLLYAFLSTLTLVAGLLALTELGMSSYLVVLNLGILFLLYLAVVKR